MLLLKNCTIIPVKDKTPSILPNTDILIDNGKIIKIEKNIKIKCETIDCTNKVVCPGFINCHTHLAMSLFKNRGSGLKLQDWLEKFIWPIEAKMAGDDIYLYSLWSMLENLENGITTVNDMYFSSPDIFKAKNEIGIDMVNTVTLLGKKDDQQIPVRINNFNELCKKYKSSENINLAIHGLYTTDEENIKKFCEVGKSNKIDTIHIHFCENENEVATIKKEYKTKSCASIIKKYFSDFKKVILAHGVFIDSNDQKILGQMKNVSVASCPYSNGLLGCGIIDIKSQMKNNINICLGTDGDGSCSEQSLQEQIKLTYLTQKALNKDPTFLQPYDLLKMATINGAWALNLEKSKGSIEVGKDADLIIYDFKSSECFPVNDIISAIIFNAKKEDIKYVFVKGKMIMKDQKCLTINKAKTLKKMIDLTNSKFKA